jgi:anti-sigma regulatory factor (Ser/Thr protein kinase)
MQKAESYIKSSFVCKSLQKQLETLLLQWYNNNVILWKLGAKPMRTGRRCADSHGGGKTETAKEDDAHEAVTFMAPYMEVGAFIEQVHSVYPEVNVEIVPYSGDNTTTCLQNMFTAGDLPDVCTLTVYVSSSLTVDDSRMSYLHGSSFAEAKERLDRIIRQQAGQRRQTFTVNTHLQHENVLADPNRLNQVLMNILSNAVKYTPTGGHIRFEVDELPRNEHYARYRFVVQDDGIGMSEAYQKTLFDPFTREERSGTNKVQGTGLGMAITKNIVDPLSRIIPTLAMTANAFLEDMQKSREAGMDKRVSAEKAHKRCK